MTKVDSSDGQGVCKIDSVCHQATYIDRILYNIIFVVHLFIWPKESDIYTYARLHNIQMSVCNRTGTHTVYLLLGLRPLTHTAHTRARAHTHTVIDD